MKFRWWVVVSAGLFALGIVSGTLTPTDIRWASGLSSSLKELAGFLAPFTISTALFIFIKNVSAMLLSFLFSPILGLLPILSLLVNGWLLGFVAEAVIQQKSLLFVLAGILPHGIFELPAMIIAQAAALGCGAAVILAIFKKDKRSALVPSLLRYVKYLLLAFILLIPAAIIETFVTPLLLGR